MGWQGSSSLQWLVHHGGEELGPYGAAALRELGGRGRLAAHDLVWTEGMWHWRRADHIEGLLPLRAEPWRMGLAVKVAMTAAIVLATVRGEFAPTGRSQARMAGQQVSDHATTDVVHGITDVVAHGTTDVADQNEYALNGFYAARAELEAVFLSVPVFAVLQRLEPATFTDLRETYVSGVLGGAPHDEMSAKVRATMMDKVIPKYERMAPDHELIAYWRTQIEKAQELSAINPRYCAEFLAPKPGTDTRELVSLFSARARQADIRALAELMVAGSEHPQKVPQGKAVQGSLRESARRAEQRVPGALQIVAKPEMATTQPSEFCHAEVAFYESILALPTHRAGPLLRYLVAQG
jgi:GYF domain 2